MDINRIQPNATARVNTPLTADRVAARLQAQWDKTLAAQHLEPNVPARLNVAETVVQRERLAYSNSLQVAILHPETASPAPEPATSAPAKTSPPPSQPAPTVVTAKTYTPPPVSAPVETAAPSIDTSAPALAATAQPNQPTISTTPPPAPASVPVTSTPAPPATSTKSSISDTQISTLPISTPVAKPPPPPTATIPFAQATPAAPATATVASTEAAAPAQPNLPLNEITQQQKLLNNASVQFDATSNRWSAEWPNPRPFHYGMVLKPALTQFIKDGQAFTFQNGNDQAQTISNRGGEIVVGSGDKQTVLDSQGLRHLLADKIKSSGFELYLTQKGSLVLATTGTLARSMALAQ